ncbi:hypothetical protein [Neorhodopirellula lusitana]|uniref:hypothetical protein n=1 Tax=Neorhodopirellula lusitana TaxID=445327 RepID=UPI0024B6D27C|nr:hypothetical protein [Neorhodopirellula lusitana]
MTKVSASGVSAFVDGAQEFAWLAQQQQDFGAGVAALRVGEGSELEFERVAAAFATRCTRNGGASTPFSAAHISFSVSVWQQQ